MEPLEVWPRRGSLAAVAVVEVGAVALFGYACARDHDAVRYLDALLTIACAAGVVLAFVASRRPLFVMSRKGIQLPASLWSGAESIPWTAITRVSTERRWLVITPSSPADPLWHHTRRLSARRRFGGNVPLPVHWMYLPARAEVLVALAEDFQCEAGRPNPAP
jgi:hypothetical protein